MTGELYDTLESFSVQDRKCFDRIMSAKIETEMLFYAGLGEAESKELFDTYGNDRVVTTAKAVSNILAENSGKLGLAAYYDVSNTEGLVQFRLRRGSKYNGLDLRAVLKNLKIEDGGGHPGAVGFRIPGKEIDKLDKFLAGLAKDLDALARAAEDKHQGTQ
jgi:nanoRNase/pAp phosphatase (c-di-AMP/oligoRNAs hydrolase)